MSIAPQLPPAPARDTLPMDFDLSTTSFARPAAGNGVLLAPSVLVRIHPVDQLERPITLGTEPLLIGREATCQLALQDHSVSRRHAMIDFNGQRHTIVDLASTNGVYVNEERITGPRALVSGDRLRIGSQIFKYLSSDQLEAQYHEVVYKLMTTDGLTGAYNKRYFLESLERELAQSKRHQSPLCVMLFDLDKFKSINDSHGRLAGDAVLVEFASRAQSALRCGDLFSRYGGEEFALLATRTALGEAAVVAERIREVTAASPVEFEGRKIPMTVSVGVACANTKAPRDPMALIAAADELLYQAKELGRNQVQLEKDIVNHA